MPIRQFEIQSTKGVEVTEVGLRAQIYARAFKYHVLVVPENVSREKLRVVASGDESALLSFRDEVAEFCARQLRLPSKSLGPLREYEGLEPNWTSYASMFTAEQTSKGVGYLQKTYEKLEEMDRKFGVIGQNLIRSNKTLDSLVKNMGSMSEINKTLKQINSTLEALEGKLK